MFYGWCFSPLGAGVSMQVLVMVTVLITVGYGVVLSFKNKLLPISSPLEMDFLPL